MEFNGQALAYLGDAVYEVLVREYLLKQGLTKSKNLHQEAVKWTSALGQVEKLKKIENVLTEEELTIIKKGRNAPLTRKARNVDLASYHYATGLEALFGYLYMSNNQTRIEDLFHQMHD